LYLVESETRDGQNTESDWSRSMWILFGTKWSWSAFFVNLLESEWSRSFVSNFKIETKNQVSVKCDFDVTIGLKSSELEWSRSMILENFSESDWSRSWICRSRSRSGV